MIRPRDFIETQEGLLFAAIDEKTHFLRYYPSPKGDRRRDRVRYSKVQSTKASFELLQRHHPAYVYETRGKLLQHCPQERIHRVHSPIIKLRSLAPTSLLAKKCLALTSIMEEIPEGSKGVTGSILVDLSMPSSDIDFVVYGENNFLKAREALAASEGVEKLKSTDWMGYYKKRFPGKPSLTFEDFIWQEERKKNIGKIKGTLFNLLSVTKSERVPESTPIGRARISCRVLDSSHPYGSPAIYKVDHGDVKMIISYTHSFTGQAFAGERIEASGVLERTDDGDKIMVVGTSREAEGEYIKVIR